MIKNTVVAAGAITFALLAAGTIAFAQTAYPKVSPSTTNNTTNMTTVTPSPTTTIPGGAPATGRGK